MTGAEPWDEAAAHQRRVAAAAQLPALPCGCHDPLYHGANCSDRITLGSEPANNATDTQLLTAIRDLTNEIAKLRRDLTRPRKRGKTTHHEALHHHDDSEQP